MEFPSPVGTDGPTSGGEAFAMFLEDSPAGTGGEISFQEIRVIGGQIDKRRKSGRDGRVLAWLLREGLEETFLEEINRASRLMGTLGKRKRNLDVGRDGQIAREVVLIREHKDE